MGVGVSTMIVSGTLLADFSLGVFTGAASSADGGENTVSRSRDFCIASRGGGSTTTAKSGIAFRGLSGDWLTPLSVTPFGLGADVLALSLND